MGIGGINITQLLVILAIVLVVFGTKRVKSLGGDLGGAIRGFRKAMDGDDDGGKADSGRQGRIEPARDAESDAAFSEPAQEETHG